MDENKNPDMEAQINAIAERPNQNKRVLRHLLDQIAEKKNSLIAVSAKMGTSNSFITSASLKWFADVLFASDLDIFNKEHKDDTAKSVSINAKTLGVVSQRKPDWRRQLAMTTYLAVRKHHKFPPALLVAYQKWIFNPDDDNWGLDQRALKDSVTHESLESASYIVDLNHDETSFYALDGQHRLMAVQGLNDLLKGNLSQKKKDGTPGKTSIKIEDIFKYDSDAENETAFRQKLHSIMDEKIGIEIIPAVQRGETLEEASARLRQIFVDVNQNAKRLEKGELALLDETDGFSIVARQTMISHSLFKRDEALLVELKSSQLNEKSNFYTTLQTIVNVTRGYLGQLDDFSKWDNYICGIKEAGRLCPDSDEIEKAKDKLGIYFSMIGKLPSHRAMIEGKPVREIRNSSEGGDDNVLFRSITQEALALAIGEMERNGSSLENIVRKLGKRDESGKSDLKLTNPSSPFFGILCDPIDKKMRRHEKYKNLATEMFTYLLNGGIQGDEEREDFRKKVFDSRRTAPDNYGEEKAVGFDGQAVSLTEFHLPAPW